MKKILLLITVALISLSSASASGYYTVTYTGTVIWNGQAVEGVKVTGYNSQNYATGDFVYTESDGSYELTMSFYYPFSGTPTCTLKATHDDYQISSKNVLITVPTVNFDLTRNQYTLTATVKDYLGALVTDATVMNGASACVNNGDGTYTCSVYSGQSFTITASKNGYVTDDYTGNVNEASNIDLTMYPETNDLTITLRDNTDNSLLTGATITTNINDCTDNNDGTYTCSVYDSTPFTITINKNGYITETNNNAGITIDTSINEGLDRTLRLVIIDDFSNPVTNGQIEINNSDNTQNLFTTTLNSNTETEFYYAVNPQTINVYFTNSEDYENNEALSQTITSNAQSTITLGTDKVWATTINVNTPTGIISGYTIKADDITCSGSNYCLLNQLTHTITINKTGYTIGTANVPAMNNGSPININVNQTLMVNATINNTSVSGLVILYNGTQMICNATLSSGIAWFAVNPNDNNADLRVEYTSPDYVNLNQTISAGTINDLSTTIVNFDTTNNIIMSIKALDYYTGEEISKSVNFKAGDTVYCTTNPCIFETMTPPSNVNITVSSNGYFTTELINRTVASETIEVILKPRALIFLNTEANLTIMDIEDDETVLSKSTNENGTASLPLDNNLEFIVIAQADGYHTGTFGPYNTTSDTIILGSESNPLVLEQIMLGGPIITELSYLPLNPTVNDTITISIKASDTGSLKQNISHCYMRINSGLWLVINETYLNESISITTSLGKLGAGNNVLELICEDITNVTGAQYSTTITVTSLEEEEEEDEEDNDLITVPNVLRLSEIRTKYTLAQSLGLSSQNLTQAVRNAELKINTIEASNALTTAENLLPLIVLSGGGSIRTTTNNNAGSIALRIATRENQPYTLSELESTIKQPVFTKTARKYLVNNEYRTIITLTIFSQTSNPDAIIADINPYTSNNENSITTSEGTITYFKGLNAGENVFEYIVNGDVNETSEPVVFTMKELSQTEKIMKGITGFSIGVPGVLEVPVVYLGIGIGIILLLVKFLI
ncbi:MAG: hypothetical protein WC307_03160 [Candidatus Nanoarchaeia archaeon]|jgi:hypothetical protein